MIRVVRQGVLDTIQDFGRWGAAKWGVNPGGVMDIFAASVANALVGNHAESPVVELHFPASEFHFRGASLISLAGADFTAFVNDVAIPLWKPVIVPANASLVFRRKIFGERCYLAVAGDLNGDWWLDSMSTNLKVSAGGFKGRSLRKGDELELRAAHNYNNTFKILPWSVGVSEVYKQRNLGFVKGHEFEWLTEESKQALLETTLTVDTHSDRMAYLLREPVASFHHRAEIISSGVSYGTVQALPDGRLMVLMAERQTTGGYPRVGYISAADLPLLAQTSPLKKVRFEMITEDASEKMLISLRKDIAKIRQSCLAKLSQYNDKR